MIAEVYPKRGANLIRLYDKIYQREILRAPEQLSDFETKNPYLYGMPLLFPPNRIEHAQFEFEGRCYKFPVNEEKTGCFVHGVMHETAFRVAKQTSDTIVLHYEATKENLYVGYPHKFILEVSYQLLENGVKQIVRILNQSDINMPIGLGFHTTFHTGDIGECRVKANVLKEFQRNEKYLPTGEYHDHTETICLFNSESGYDTKNELSALFSLGDHHTVLLELDNRIKIRYQLDEKYPYLMVFNTGSDGNYVCIEPQSWISNCPHFENREAYGFSYVKPQEEVSYSTSIFVE